MSIEHEQLFSRPECHKSIRQYAILAASVVYDVGHAFTKLEPGDGTRYDFVIVYNMIENKLYVGVSNFSQSQGNGIFGYTMERVITFPSYVSEKSGIQSSSANVVADFINCLRDELKNLDKEYSFEEAFKQE